MDGVYGLIITGCAAFVAGVINAIAGGGSFFTFPALVLVGVPGIMANATSAIAVLPGYIGGALGFSKEIAGFDRKALGIFCLLSVCGAFIGASLLLVTSREIFDVIVPFLLIAATLLFAFNQKIIQFLKQIPRENQDKPIIHPYMGLFAVSVYGGYFNGGLGILLLALFAIIGLSDIHMMNGLKSLLSFVLSLMSAVTFTVAGLVDWNYAAIMMVMATLGGYIGAKWSKRLSKQLVSWIVITTGTITSIIFLYRLF